jgi:hypothetical protein
MGVQPSPPQELISNKHPVCQTPWGGVVCFQRQFFNKIIKLRTEINEKVKSKI